MEAPRSPVGISGAEDTGEHPNRVTGRAHGTVERGAPSWEEPRLSPLRRPSNDFTHLRVIYSSSGCFLEPYF